MAAATEGTISTLSSTLSSNMMLSTTTTTSPDKNSNWTIYSCSQNLPAILNDPKRGKQKDFFTRHWGDSFIETTNIPPSSRLEHVPMSYFVPYCRKLRRRNRKSSIDQRRLSCTSSDLLISNPLFPAFLIRESSSDFKPETSPIPRLFFSSHFNMSNCETFCEVYEVDTNSVPSKMIQDKLSHYLDLVEVGLAQQISRKSSAFFSAVSSQDKVAEKVSQAFHSVRQIKELLTQAKRDYVQSPQKIISMAKQKSNLILVLQKLMGTVHQAQRAIQSLLGNSDYVGALDLIATTQEVLRQELHGLISFRHLDSQLIEIRNAIEKMLRAEFIRNLSSDLNRPIDQISSFYDKDRLISIILGHLRIGKVAPIVVVLSKEISTAMTATCKETLIEAVSESDSKSDSNLIGSMAIQLSIPQLSRDLWLKMIGTLNVKLLHLLDHINDLINLIEECGGNTKMNEYDESPLLNNDLKITLLSELGNQLEKTVNTADEKFTQILRNRKSWIDRNEFIGTLLIVRKFIEELEGFIEKTGKKTTYRFTSGAELRVQMNDFFRDFHKKQMERVNVSLDHEKWRIVPEDVIRNRWPSINISNIIQIIQHNIEDSNIEDDMNGNKDNEKSIIIIQDPIRTAEVFFVILYTMAEYVYLMKLTGGIEVMLGLVELLRGANLRLAHLILGAGAVELKSVKSITVANLAIVIRGLCLIIDGFPNILDEFRIVLSSKNHHLLKHLETVELEIIRHSNDLENKMLFIISEVMDSELIHWEAKPPVPSTSLNSISKTLTKFKESITPILTQKQISDLFLRVDKLFRNKLKDRIALLGILKDGGPRHGVVTSEMMHYAENLRKLGVLPANVISNAGLTVELWSTTTTTTTTSTSTTSSTTSNILMSNNGLLK